MQAIIANLIKKLSDKGLKNDEIALYLQGLFDGMQLVCSQLQSNKTPVTKEETDPAFAHNWNYILDQLTDAVNATIQQAYDSVPKDKDNGHGTGTKTNS